MMRERLQGEKVPGRAQPKRLESRHTDQRQASTRNPLAYGRSFRYHTPALIRAYSSVG